VEKVFKPIDNPTGAVGKGTVIAKNQLKTKQAFSDFYKQGKLLGSGAFGEVRECVHNGSG